MSKEIVIPDYIKAMTSSAGASAEDLVGAVSSVPRISLKGQKFRFIVDGEEEAVEKESTHLVILGVQPDAPRLMSKTYYADAYNPNDSGPPDCSSSDGLVPDSWVQSPQSEHCATCANNKWGSATSKMTGKKAKACRDSKRLFVVRPKEIDDGLIYILNVTISSLKALSEYGKHLASHNIPLSTVITTVTLDDESDFPRVDFTVAGIMKEDAGMKAIARSQKKEWDEFKDKQIGHDNDGAGSNKAALADNSKPAKVESTDAVEGEVVEKESAPSAKNSDIDDILNEW